MCTVMMLRRPGQDWPFLLGGNRDEMQHRPWKAPGRHWPDREDVIAGLDETAGGSWLGVNEKGVMAVILNRYGTLGPAPDKRSRGELVLEALDHHDAVAAAQALADLRTEAYRSFNLVIADNRDAFWLRNLGQAEGQIDVIPIPEGASMLSAFDLNDLDQSARLKTHFHHFEAASPPTPDQPDGFKDWITVLSSRARGETNDPGAAMTVERPDGFGTVSSSFVALPSPEKSYAGQKPLFLFAPGPPDRAVFSPVAGFG